MSADSQPLAVSTAALAAAVLMPGVAQANIPDIAMIWDASDDANVPTILGGAPPVYGEHSISDQTYVGWQYAGEVEDAAGGWTLAWNVVYNDAPADGVAGNGDVLAFVVAEMAVTNTYAAAVTYDLTVTLPVIPPVAKPLIRGTVGAALTGSAGELAMLSAPTGSQIYTPFINGIQQPNGLLWTSDAFSLTADPVETASDEFGIPDGVKADQASATNMGVRLHFELSSGASAKVTGKLELIPAPGGLPLLAAFGVLAGRRRRQA